MMGFGDDVVLMDGDQDSGRSEPAAGSLTDEELLQAEIELGLDPNAEA